MGRGWEEEQSSKKRSRRELGQRRRRRREEESARCRGRKCEEVSVVREWRQVGAGRKEPCEETKD